MANETPAEKKDTKRVVMKRERVLVLPDGMDAVDEKKLREALGLKGSTPKFVTGEAWMVVDEQVGATMDKAIEAYTGPAGAPDTKVGVFKAPTVRAFAGGVEMKAPPKPLVQKAAIE